MTKNLRAYKSKAGRRRGFTLIELLIVIAILGVIVSGALVATQTVIAKRRDAKRLAEAAQFQRVMALYYDKMKVYPTFTGCMDGADAVNVAARAQGVIAGGSVFKDPLNPTNIASCYFYTSADGASYSFRYTIEAGSGAAAAGTYTLMP